MLWASAASICVSRVEPQRDMWNMNPLGRTGGRAQLILQRNIGQDLRAKSVELTARGGCLCRNRGRAWRMPIALIGRHVHAVIVPGTQAGASVPLLTLASDPAQGP